MGQKGVLFCEHHAAAQSLNNGRTRLASTYGCMMVELTPEKLVIQPHLFAGWLIRLFQLDLYHEIPLAKITGVIVREKWASRGKVEVLFQTREGRKTGILLYLKQARAFRDTLTATISRTARS